MLWGQLLPMICEFLETCPLTARVADSSQGGQPGLEDNLVLETPGLAGYSLT